MLICVVHSQVVGLFFFVWFVCLLLCFCRNAHVFICLQDCTFSGGLIDLVVCLCLFAFEFLRSAYVSV